MNIGMAPVTRRQWDCLPATMTGSILFTGTLLLVIGFGAWHVLHSSGHPHPATQLPVLPAATATISLWLLLKVFSSGCTAMTGVEAVSNGVMAFRDDTRRNAKITLTIIIVLLAMLLAGIALLCRAYGIAATNPLVPGYESVLSMLTRAVMGHGWFYHLTIGSVLLVLALSANTAFADFPRLTRAIALDDYMPHVFLLRGRRLLYSWGIYVLVALTALLLVVFGGITDRLIPLYAVGAFMAFTLSQAGMVMHWKRKGGFPLRMFVNSVGALATGITAVVVLVAKFVDGAWITALLVLGMILAMRAVKRHYVRVGLETALDRPIVPAEVTQPIVIVPIDRWRRITEKALSFALSMSTDIRCLHVQTVDELDPICRDWELDVAAPLRAAGKCVPKLEVLQSPFRYLLTPVVEYILAAERESKFHKICVLVPELVGEPIAQPPRRPVEGDSADARQPPHCGHQYSVVSGVRLVCGGGVFSARAVPIRGPQPSKWRVAPQSTNKRVGRMNGSSRGNLRPVGFLVVALLLFAPLFASSQEAQQASEGSQQVPPVVSSDKPVKVRGSVSNAATGEPLPRVLVRIEGDADAGVLTDGEGRFEVPAVPPGPQTFRLLKPGFRDRPYAAEEVDYQSEGPAHNVLVAAGMPDLNFSLTPNGAIHGYVELSTGDPAQDIPVILAKQVVRNGRAVWAQSGNARTNGDGSYRFAGLPEGVYAVYTQPVLESEPAADLVAADSAGSMVQNGYPSVFYPASHDFSSAMRIRLAIGEQAQANLSLILEPFQTVTATAWFPDGHLFAPKRGSESGADSSFVSATVMDAAGRRLPYAAQFDGATHTVQTALPDGVYTLQIRVKSNDSNARGGDQATEPSSRQQATFTGFAEFSVEGHAVTNLRIPLSTLPNRPVRLRLAQTAMRSLQSSVSPRQGLQRMVTISAIDAGEMPTNEGLESATSEASGPEQLDLNGAGSGPLWIDVQLNDRSICVDSFTAGDINLAREPLNLNPSATPPPMELTLRADCASLTLTLPPALSAFLPGEEPFYTVYVVPDFDTTADIAPMNIHASSGATLTVEGLTPGNYHVYAFDSPVRLEYRNPAVLAALPVRGQAVMLSPGSSASLVLEVPGR